MTESCENEREKYSKRPDFAIFLGLGTGWPTVKNETENGNRFGYMETGRTQSIIELVSRNWLTKK